MANIYNCDPSELIEKSSEELKKLESIKAPDWALFVKTGMHKERPPLKNDWWYVRTASVLRQIYRFGPIGVSKLRTKYGGKKNRGVKKSHFYKASGSIIRKIIQQLEKEEFVKKDLKSVHKGRSITSKGKKFLDDIAKTISKAEVKVEKKEPEVKTEAKEKPQEAKPETKKETTPVKKETPKKDEKQMQKEVPKTQ
jgi:small subunit ribosomal protein S19e